MPLLFSYGTLRDEAVQKSTFGRLLYGEPDELVGFELHQMKIVDPRFLNDEDETHSIVRFNARDESRVSGLVFEVADSELASADEYEPAGYERISTILASGKEAWVYAGDSLAV